MSALSAAHMRQQSVNACEPVTVCLSQKGSCQDNVKVPGVDEARLASPARRLVTRRPRCATQHGQVNLHTPSAVYELQMGVNRRISEK